MHYPLAAEEYGLPCVVGESRNAWHNGRIGWTVRTLESAGRIRAGSCFAGANTKGRDDRMIVVIPAERGVRLYGASGSGSARPMRPRKEMAAHG
jgi:hypothetical protein